MPHRPPTASDIGKTVEVRFDEDGQWEPATLEYILYGVINDGPGASVDCRVPYTSPDPIAELSMAADWLAERGMDEAARVLMEEVERLKRNESERYGGFFISQLPVDSVKTRHDGWFYVHDEESDYLRKDGRFHGTCGDEGFYETREEARQAIDDYNALTPSPPEPQS